MLWSNPWTSESRFQQGDLFIVEGVAFYIDANDPTTLYAASPSETDSTERMNLIVTEAIRVLPLFLAKHPHLHRLVRGRKLKVRMIASYETVDSVIREQAIDRDLIDSILGDD